MENLENKFYNTLLYEMVVNFSNKDEWRKYKLSNTNNLDYSHIKS